MIREKDKDSLHSNFSLGLIMLSYDYDAVSVVKMIIYDCFFNVFLLLFIIVYIITIVFVGVG